VPEVRFKGFTDDWEQRLLSEIVKNIGTGHSAYNLHKRSEKYSYPILGSTSIIGYDSKYDYSGKFVLTARVGANAGSLYRYEGKAQITDNTVYLECEHPILLESLLNHFDLRKLSFGTGQPLIKASSLKKLKTRSPSKRNEIDNISIFLSLLEKIIYLQVEKLTLYESLKEYMLQVIFPSINENIPIVRFTGFHDNWEQLRFDDLFEGLKNNTLSRDKLNYSRGSIQNIHYGDILTKFNEILNISNNNIPYINPQYSKNSIGNLLVDGDIIFADTAEDDMVGKCIEIQKMDKYKVVSGLHTMAVRPNKIISRYYLGYYLNSKYYQIQLVPLMQGVKVLSISKKNISGTHIDYPNNNLEEEKIGTMLQSIDKICILQKNTLSKLKQLKKYYLKKLFI